MKERLWRHPLDWKSSLSQRKEEERFQMNKQTNKKKKNEGPEEMCLSLEHQNPSKASEKMGYFDRVTVSLHIL